MTRCGPSQANGPITHNPERYSDNEIRVSFELTVFLTGEALETRGLSREKSKNPGGRRRIDSGSCRPRGAISSGRFCSSWSGHLPETQYRSKSTCEARGRSSATAQSHSQRSLLHSAACRVNARSVEALCLPRQRPQSRPPRRALRSQEGQGGSVQGGRGQGCEATGSQSPERAGKKTKKQPPRPPRDEKEDVQEGSRRTRLQEARKRSPMVPGWPFRSITRLTTEAIRGP